MHKKEFSFTSFFVPLTTSKAIHIIIIIGFIVYFNSLFNGFVWDDLYQIVTSPAVQFAHYNYYFTHTIGPFYKPLMFVVYILLYQLFQLNAFFYHLFQVNLHILNAILIFLLLQHFSKKITLSLSLSLLFLIHPINAETVEYIANFQDVMFLFFGLLAIFVIIKKSFWRYKHIVISSLLLLSLFSKESGILFAIVYPLYFFFFEKKECFKAFIFSGITVAIYYTLRYIWVGSINVMHYDIIPPDVILNASLYERLLTIPKIIYTYFSLLVFPDNLSIQYWVVRSVTFTDFIWPLIIDICLGLIIFVVGMYLFRKNKKLFNQYLFFFIWFGVGVGIHLQIVPLDKTLADRWFYFPFIGLLGMIISVLSLDKMHLFLNKKSFVIFIIVIVYCILAFVTILRNTHWYSGVTLFKHELIKQPNVYELQYNYGYSLMQEGRHAEAIKPLKKSIALIPNNPVAIGNLCYSYLRASMLNDAEACYHQLISSYKNQQANYGPFILVYLLQNKSESAIKLAEEAVKKSPSDALLWRALGLAAYQQHDKELALKAFEKSYSLMPNHVTYSYLNQVKKDQPIEMQEL